MNDAFSHRNNVLFYYTIIFLNINKNFQKKLYFFRNTCNRTKTVPWHILAPAVVTCDINPIHCSAHPRGTYFFIYWKVTLPVNKEIRYQSLSGSDTA